MKRLLVMAAALVGVGVSAQGAMITGVTATSSMGTYATYGIAPLTDGTGLSTPISVTSVHDAAYNHMWMSNGTATGTLIFDLGQEHELTNIAIWQYNLAGLLDRGVKSYSLDFSLDGVSYKQLQASAQLPMGTGADGLAPVVIGVPENTSARYVRMNIASTWGASYVGLSEVQFAEPTINLPEPTIVSALLATSAGLMIRKRQKNA